MPRLQRRKGGAQLPGGVSRLPAKMSKTTPCKVAGDRWGRRLKPDTSARQEASPWSNIKVVQDQAKARLDQTKAETDAKVKALQDQAKAASGMAKARIEKRIALAKADFETRPKKLSQAWTLTKEALAA
jgi:hypothetical protein